MVNCELSLAVAHHPLCRSFQPHWHALVAVAGACGCLYRNRRDSKRRPRLFLLRLCRAVCRKSCFLSSGIDGGRDLGGTTNPTTLIFIVDTSIFGLLCLVGFGSDPFAAASTTHGIVSVLFGGIAVGMAYTAWTLGMSRGNMAVLAAASYFTPVLSCVFATFWTDAKLDSGFWSGVALVVAGALLCWDATGRGMRALKSRSK